MARQHIRKKSAPARRKVMRETAALRALRAALADFADVEVVAPAVKPKGIGTKAIRKAVHEFYHDPKTLERA